MALTITEECTSCSACEPECPKEAISRGDGVYVIDQGKCTECEGEAQGPSCASVCPIDCCVKP